MGLVSWLPAMNSEPRSEWQRGGGGCSIQRDVTELLTQCEVRHTEQEPGRCIHVKRGATYRAGARPMHSCEERCDIQSGSPADAFM